MSLLHRKAPWFLTLSAFFGYAACHFADRHWILELVVHWRLHMAVATLVLALVFFLQSRSAFGYAMLALALAFGWPAWQALKPVAGPQGEARDRLTLLQFNISYRNEHLAREVIPWIIAQDADIVILQEVDASRAGELGALKAHYAWSRIEPSTVRRAFGAAIFTRLPVKEYRRIPTGFNGNKYSFLALHTPMGKTLHLYEIHLSPPVLPGFSEGRMNDLRFMGKLLGEDKAAHKLLAGDLNSTIYSPHFIAMAQAAGLHHAQAGFRMEGTWPQYLPAILGIGIDHSLGSQAISFSRREIGPRLGSDHFPVTTTLTLFE